MADFRAGAEIVKKSLEILFGLKARRYSETEKMRVCQRDRESTRKRSHSEQFEQQN